MREKLLGFLAWIFFSTLVRTWRIQLIESEEMQDFLKNKKPFVMAHWHGDELMLVHLARRYRMATLASKSKDGEIMAYVLGKLAQQL